MKKSMKMLSLILSAVMILSAVPVTAYGQEADFTESIYETDTEPDLTVQETADDETPVEDEDCGAVTDEPSEDNDPEDAFSVAGDDELLSVTGTLVGGGSYTLSNDGKTLTLDGTDSEKPVLTLFDFFADENRTEYLFASENVTSVTITGYKELGQACFDDDRWTSLKNVTLCEGLEKLNEGVFFWIGIESISLPNSLKHIGVQAFDHTKIKNLTLPSNVEYIGHHAFTDCYNLETITLNDGLKTIDSDAFYCCPKLKNLVIPDSVTSHNKLGIGWCRTEINGEVFNESLETLSIPISAVPLDKYILDETQYEFDPILLPVVSFKKITFTEGNGSWPEVIDYSNHSVIGAGNSVENPDYSYEIEFADGVTSVPKKAFEYCDCLSKVTFAPSVSTIGEEAFSNIKSLTDVVFNEGTGADRTLSFGYRAFWGCRNIKELTFPKDVKRIDTAGWVFKSWGDDNKPDGIKDVYFYHPKTELYSGGSVPDDFSEGSTMHAYKWKAPDGSRYFSVQQMVERNNSINHLNYYKFKALGGSTPVVPVKPPVTVKGISLSHSSVVKYVDEAVLHPKVSLVATITPANVSDASITFNVRDGSDGVTGVLTRSSDYDAVNGQYGIFATLTGNTGTDILYVETRDKNSNVQYSAECRITVKEREASGKPYFRWISGDGTANGDLAALYSDTPGAQIFYSSDADAMNNADAYVTYDGNAKKYVSSSDAIKEYRSPLVLGKDITEDSSTIHAFAVRYPLKMSLPAAKEFTVPLPDSVWGDINDEDKASEFGGDENNLIDENGLSEEYKGLWVPEAQLTDTELVYTGKAVTIPDLRVYFGTHLLTLGTDYTLGYSSNTDPTGNAKIKVSLKGNYSGGATLDFTIGKCPVTEDGITYLTLQISAKQQKGVFTGQKPDPKVTVKSTGKALKNGTDVKIMFRLKGSEEWNDSVTEPGVYSVRLDNVTGSKYDFPSGENAIVLDNAVYCSGGGTIAMSKATVSRIAAQDITQYDGPVEPAFTVKYQNADLVGKKDGEDGNAHYTYSFKDQNGSGTATLRIKGTGTVLNGKSFIGVTEAKFKINGIPFTSKNISITGINNEYKYSGAETVPDYVVKYGNEILVKDKDFTVSYSKNGNTDAGKVDMIFTGMGRFSGSLKSGFKIVPRDASGFVFKDQDGNPWNGKDQCYVFSKSGVFPKVRIYPAGNDDPLTEGKDYTVKYSANKAVGAYNDMKSNKPSGPSVSISFKGNYKGNKTLYFTISKADLGNGFRMSLNDLTVSSSPKKYMQKPVISDAHGNVLKSGTDYDGKTIKYTYDEDTEVTRKTGAGKTLRITAASLEAGTEVSDEDIIPAGSVIRVCATGIGNYEGEISDTYTFMADKIASLKFSIVPGKTFYYTGSAVTPRKSDLKVQVKNGSKWEDAGPEADDFYDIISYSNNVKKGAATLTVRGRNGYAGTADVKFSIVSP